MLALQILFMIGLLVFIGSAIAYAVIQLMHDDVRGRRVRDIEKELFIASAIRDAKCSEFGYISKVDNSVEYRRKRDIQDGIL